MEGVDNSYSVLMSVYVKEKAEYLRTAMDSIWNQTIPTDDFVLVCDGPLNEGLDAVIEKMEEEHPDTLHVVRLEKNSGLGNALNEGIKHCRHKLVARMDSDDISRPDRCERQLKVFQEHPDTSVVSGIVEEFTTSTTEIEARRVPPETQEEIITFAKKRNPFNHPCVMYKNSPKVLTDTDFDRMMGSGKLLARKVDSRQNRLFYEQLKVICKESSLKM